MPQPTGPYITSHTDDHLVLIVSFYETRYFAERLVNWPLSTFVQRQLDQLHANDLQKNGYHVLKKFLRFIIYGV